GAGKNQTGGRHYPCPCAVLIRGINGIKKAASAAFFCAIVSWSLCRRLSTQPCAPWPHFVADEWRHSPHPKDRRRTRAPKDGFTASCGDDFCKTGTGT